MNSIRIALILAALTGAAACGEAGRDGSAQDSQARAEKVVPRYADADRDGRVTREEAEADPALAASFERYDADRSGALDRGEFSRLEAGAAASAKADQHEAPQQRRPREEFATPH